MSVVPGRFYSPDAVGRALVSLVAGDPGRALDVASGGGALWRAALERWPDLSIDTVDLDPGAAHPPWPHRHSVADAMAGGWDARGGYDLVLCNPPFARARHRGMRGPSCASRAFVDLCLGMARDGGTVAMVLPDGLVTGARERIWRERLLTEHMVTHVVEVGRGAFRATEARTHLLLLYKGRAATGSIVVSRLDGEGRPATHLSVPRDSGIIRLDHAHHAATGGTGPTLADLGGHVARGNVTRSEAARRGTPVFHLGGFDGAGRVVLGDLPVGLPRGAVVAIPGDILMARLGRRLHEQVAIVEAGDAVITDAVFRVRMPEASRDHALAALTSRQGMASIAATARGVGMRMLGKADLLSMRLPA